MATCDHSTDAAPPAARTEGCEECLATDGRWVAVRLCRTCGHVGCCDSSAGKHATAHYHGTEHAVMQSFEPGEDWGWCYVHEETLGPFQPAR